MFGASHYVVPADWHTHIIDWRERLRRRKWTRQDLEDYDVEIRDLYFHIRETLLNPKLPELQNTDGDPLELTTLRFALTVPVGEAFEHLLPLATVGGEQYVSDVEHDVSGVITHVEMSWLKAGNRKHASWDNTILGRLVLDPGALVAEVNSSRRANRLTREIRTRLGDGARLVDRRVHDLEADLRDRQQARGRGTAVEPCGLRRPSQHARTASADRRDDAPSLDGSGSTSGSPHLGTRRHARPRARRKAASAWWPCSANSTGGRNRSPTRRARPSAR